MRIREACSEDAPTPAALLAELGYPDDVDHVVTRVSEFESDAGSLILVAEDEGTVVGLASATLLPLLHEDGCWCRLSALVVARRSRRRGLVADSSRRSRSVHATRAVGTSR